MEENKPAGIEEYTPTGMKENTPAGMEESRPAGMEENTPLMSLMEQKITLSRVFQTFLENRRISSFSQSFRYKSSTWEITAKFVHNIQ